MREWLFRVTETTVLAIDAMALVVIAAGTVIAFAKAVRMLWAPLTGYQRREIWLGYARWLVAGLTFQLAADILESSIASSWEAVGRLAAVAAIRTFLDYFLERDLAERRELQHERTSEPVAAK